MMKKYDSYKDSGIEWLGQIPEHWDILSFRFNIDTLTDYTANGSFASLAENVKYLESGYSRLVRLTDLRVNLENEGIYVDEQAHKFLKKSELFGGEMLIANVGAYAGLVMLMPKLEGKFTLAPNMFLLRLNQNSQFFYHQLNAPFCAEQLKMMAISSAQPKLNKDNIRELKVLKPLPEEQTAIANYLDQKTAQIDDLISKKQRLIELLQEERTAMINQAVTKGLYSMDNGKLTIDNGGNAVNCQLSTVNYKDSGIEWLGEIPVHWEVKRMKYICDIGTGDKDTENNEVNGEYPFFVRSQTIERISTYSFDGEAILTAGDGVGVCKVWHYINGKFDYHQRVYRMSDFKEIMGKYLFYYLKENFVKEVKKLSAKSTVDSLRRPMFQNFQIAFGTLKEQLKIVNYIECESNRIETIINKTEQEINLLKEYKTALISEVVTGKVKVIDN